MQALEGTCHLLNIENNLSTVLFLFHTCWVLFVKYQISHNSDSLYFSNMSFACCVNDVQGFYFFFFCMKRMFFVKYDD